MNCGAEEGQPHWFEHLAAPHSQHASSVLDPPPNEIFRTRHEIDDSEDKSGIDGNLTSSSGSPPGSPERSASQNFP